MGRPTIVIDLAQDAQLARDLSAGGVFVLGSELTFNDDCDLIVRGHGGELSFEARCVYVDPQRGAGLELVGFCPAIKEQLAELARAVEAAPVEAPLELLDIDDPHALQTVPYELADDDDGHLAADEPPTDAQSDDASAEVQDDADAQADADLGDEAQAPLTPTQKIARNMHDRLRGLSLIEQLKIAHAGEPSERMVLERMYGKNVWEALLRNPRLTAPEVARLARLGTLPRTLVEVILNNGAWLQIPEVRRALLANPRLGTDQVLRVLRMLPKHELKLASTMTAYPMAVRDAAKRLIKQNG